MRAAPFSPIIRAVLFVLPQAFMGAMLTSTTLWPEALWTLRRSSANAHVLTRCHLVCAERVLRHPHRLAQYLRDGGVVSGGVLNVGTVVGTVGSLERRRPWIPQGRTDAPG